MGKSVFEMEVKNMNRISNTIKTVLVLLSLSLSMIFVAGCGENADLPINETIVPEYETLNTIIENYKAGYNAYMTSTDGSFETNQAEATTPSGTMCTGVYAVSSNGVYETLTVEASYEDRTVYDEYYKLSDTQIYVRRSILFSNGQAVPGSVYFVDNGALYELDDETSSVTKIDKADSMDLYLSFDEITETYGG